MNTAFDNVRLPEDVEQGALMGPSFSTGITELSSGAEQRNANWDQDRAVIDISYGISQKRDAVDREDSYIRVLDFFRARLGRQRSFLFRDWSDYECQDEPVAFPIVSKNKVQIQRVYGPYYARRITRPQPETVVLRLGEIEIPAEGYTVGTPGQPDYVNVPAWQLGEYGVIQFASDLEVFYPGLTVSCLYDLAVRFNMDKLQASLTLINAGSVPNITLIQIREGEAI